MVSPSTTPTTASSSGICRDRARKAWARPSRLPVPRARTTTSLMSSRAGLTQSRMICLMKFSSAFSTMDTITVQGTGRRCTSSNTERYTL